MSTADLRIMYDSGVLGQSTLNTTLRWPTFLVGYFPYGANKSLDLIALIRTLVFANSI